MQTKDGYAVLGTDGMSIVVWGVGDTESEARGDFARWSDDVSASAPTETVKITAEQRERIESGDVNAESIGLLTRSEAQGVAYRLARAA